MSDEITPNLINPIDALSSKGNTEISALVPGEETDSVLKESLKRDPLAIAMTVLPPAHTGLVTKLLADPPIPVEGMDKLAIMIYESLSNPLVDLGIASIMSAFAYYFLWGNIKEERFRNVATALTFLGIWGLSFSLGVFGLEGVYNRANKAAEIGTKTFYNAESSLSPIKPYLDTIADIVEKLLGGL